MSFCHLKKCIYFFKIKNFSPLKLQRASYSLGFGLKINIQKKFSCFTVGVFKDHQKFQLCTLLSDTSLHGSPCLASFDSFPSFCKV